MTTLSRQSREILERARTAETLAESSQKRMYATLVERLAWGEVPLPEIDASDVVLPKTSWFAKLFATASSKVWLTTLGAVLVGTGIWSLSNYQLSETRAPAITPKQLSSSPVKNSARPAPSIEQVEESSAITAEQVVKNEPSVKTGHFKSVREHRGAARSANVSTRVRSQSQKPTITDTPVIAASDPSSKNAALSAVNPSDVPSRVQAKAPASTTLDIELRLLHRAYSELNAGRPEQALSVLAEHKARFPRGHLAQTRDVAFMLALCGAGQQQTARTLARRFIVEHPDSPYLSRVRSVCSNSPKKGSP